MTDAAPPAPGARLARPGTLLAERIADVPYAEAEASWPDLIAAAAADVPGTPESLVALLRAALWEVREVYRAELARLATPGEAPAPPRSRAEREDALEWAPRDSDALLGYLRSTPFSDIDAAWPAVVADVLSREAGSRVGLVALLAPALCLARAVYREEARRLVAADPPRRGRAPARAADRPPRRAAGAGPAPFAPRRGAASTVRARGRAARLAELLAAVPVFGSRVRVDERWKGGTSTLVVEIADSDPRFAVSLSSAGGRPGYVIERLGDDDEAPR